MKRLFASVGASVLLALTIFSTTSAVEFKVGNDVYLDGNTPINDDIYAAGGTINVLQDVYGDLIVAGGMVTVEGNVNGDVIVAGGKVTINGNVGDDLRIGGGQVEVTGNVNDDLLIFGGTGTMDKKSFVGGDVILGGGLFELKGEVGGNVQGTTGKLSITGNVRKNVDVTVTSDLYISNSSRIGGDLMYRSPNEITDGEFTIRGKTEYQKYEIESPFSKEDLKKWMTASYISYKVFVFIAYVLLALILVLTAPMYANNVALMAHKEFWKSLGVGALTFLVLIAGTFIALVSGVGFFVGIFMAAAGIVLYLFAQVLVGIILGSYLVKFGKKPTKTRLFFSYVLGFLIYSLVTLIPIVGWAFGIIAYLVSVGAIVLTKMDVWALLRQKKMM